jgi:hypothetical protein
MRTASFSLFAILCLAVTGFAQTIFSEGPIDGNDNAFFVTGPNFPNLVGSFQDISNGFVAASSSNYFTDLEFGEWSVGAPTSFSWSVGSGAFGNDIGSGTVAQNAFNSVFLFTNAFGWGVYNVTVQVTSLSMTAGNTYWLSISNATGAIDGTQAWDVPNGGLGGPATCNVRQSGINLGDCGLGGESFTLSAHVFPSTPESSSILLFGSGILGLAGILRRKLNIQV